MSDKAVTLTTTIDVGETWRDPDGEIWRVTDIRVEASVGSLSKTVVDLERTIKRSVIASDMPNKWAKLDDANG